MAKAIRGQQSSRTKRTRRATASPIKRKARGSSKTGRIRTQPFYGKSDRSVLHSKLLQSLQKMLGKSAHTREGEKSLLLEDVLLDTQGPPDGYVFVPKGNVYVTRNCRAQTHKSNMTVFTVYNAARRTTLGLYIPIGIFTAVQASADATVHTRQRAVAQKDARDTLKAEQMLHRHFPNMPVHDVEEVLAHAFLKGSRRVGRSGTVKSEEKKVVLAVEAHIRHVHTHYETLLATGMQRGEARAVVWDSVRGIKAEWIGESAVAVNQSTGRTRT